MPECSQPGHSLALLHHRSLISPQPSVSCENRHLCVKPGVLEGQQRQLPAGALCAPSDCFCDWDVCQAGCYEAHAEQKQHEANHAGKEYAKADSRYARRESCVLGIEGLTAAVLGPLSFVVMYGIAGRKPWRHTLAMLVSMGQLWGDLLYFLSAHLEGGSVTGRLQHHLLFLTSDALLQPDGAVLQLR